MRMIGSQMINNKERLYQLTKPELREEKTKRADFKNLVRNDIYIILDSLKCAHNIGTILRLADSLLVKKVYICGDTIVPPNRKIKTSSRGAEKWTPWEYNESSISVAKSLKEQGVQIVAVEVANNSIDYREFEPKSSVCIVLGREFDGVSQEILDICDCAVHLPLLGMSNSLNVSTAGSVILYDVYAKQELLKSKT